VSPHFRAGKTFFTPQRTAVAVAPRRPPGFFFFPRVDGEDMYTDRPKPFLPSAGVNSSKSSAAAFLVFPLRFRSFSPLPF